MEKILIIEDDIVLMGMYEIKFKHAGYEVQTAIDGEQGLAKIREFKPDLVLLDLLIPKINGKAVFEKVRIDPEYKGVRVAILTNVDNPRDRIEFMKNGAEAFFIKSEMTPSQVVEGVEEILKHGSQNTIG